MHMKLILLVLLMSTLFGGALFGAAGRWDLPFFWAYILLFQFMLLGSGIYFLKTSPGMVQERLRPGPGGKDSVTRPVGALLMLAHLVVAGLDVGRFHWQPHVPFAVQVVALAAVAASLGGSMWAMSVNPFFPPQSASSGSEAIESLPLAHIGRCGTPAIQARFSGFLPARWLWVPGGRPCLCCQPCR